MDIDENISKIADTVVKNMMVQANQGWDELVESRSVLAKFKDDSMFKKLYQLAFVTGYMKALEDYSAR